MTHSTSESKFPKSPEITKEGGRRSVKASTSMKQINPLLHENTQMTKYLNASFSKDSNIFLDIHRLSKDKPIPQKPEIKYKKNRTSINLKQTSESGNNGTKSHETLDSIQSLQVTKV